MQGDVQSDILVLMGLQKGENMSFGNLQKGAIYGMRPSAGQVHGMHAH